MGHTGSLVLITVVLSVAQIWCKPYKVYWNVPTTSCKKYFGIDFYSLVNSFGITINDNDDFRGNKMSILYKPGLFPQIQNYSMSTYVQETDYKNLYFINGGIPQCGNLSAHLDAFEEQVKKDINDTRNDGLMVIDMEHWGATWQQNFNDMEIHRIESRLKVKRENPTFTDAEVEAKAKLEFERGADKFLSASLQIGKSTRPYGIWGYYQYPQCFNQPGVDYCSQTTMLDNNQMIRMWKLSDAVFPSCYLSNVSTVAARASIIRGAVREATRVAVYANKTLLNIPYIWTKYFEGEIIIDADLDNLIKVPKEEGADGVVIWGASIDYNSADKCRKFKDYVTQVLGPIAKKYISTT